MWVFSPVAEGVAVALPCDKLSVQIFTFAKGSRETAPCSNWFPAAQGLFSEPKREVERQNAIAHFSKTALTAASAHSVSLVSVKFAGDFCSCFLILPQRPQRRLVMASNAIEKTTEKLFFFFYARSARWTSQVVKLKRYWRHCKLPTGAGDQLVWNQSYT